VNEFTGEPYACRCGEEFTAAGTRHGQPAALWELLEHQATEHG
jgi:hypothetical protein